MSRHHFTLDDDGLAVVATLADGRRLRMSFHDRLGVDGYEVHVCTEREALIVQPSSGNAITLSTPASLDVQRARIADAVATRRRETGR